MSRFEDPVIITCSISGAVANREQCPAIPYTPEEYAAEARRIVDEGGSMIHIHARTPDGVPSYEIEDFRNITDAILAEVDDVIINYSTGAVGVPIEKRHRVPARAAARGRRAEHGLDELREVLEAPQGVRLPHRVRELVRDDHHLPEGDERARHQARARVLRLRPHREPRPAARHGPAARAAADLVRDGRDRRHPPERAQPRAHVGADPRRRRGPEQLGRDRHLARPVDARRRGAHARRQLPRRARGQLLPAERRDGALQRRPDREGAPDGGGRRPPAGDRRRGARDARDPEDEVAAGARPRAAG